MKRCPSCGQDNPDESRYCVKCGAELGASTTYDATSASTGPMEGEVIGHAGGNGKKGGKWWIWVIIAVAAVIIIGLICCGLICCCIAGGCGMISLPFMNQ